MFDLGINGDLESGRRKMQSRSYIYPTLPVRLKSVCTLNPDAVIRIFELTVIYF